MTGNANYLAYEACATEHQQTRCISQMKNQETMGRDKGLERAEYLKMRAQSVSVKLSNLGPDLLHWWLVMTAVYFLQTASAEKHHHDWFRLGEAVSANSVRSGIKISYAATGIFLSNYCPVQLASLCICSRRFDGTACI